MTVYRIPIPDRKFSGQEPGSSGSPRVERHGGPQHAGKAEAGDVRIGAPHRTPWPLSANPAPLTMPKASFSSRCVPHPRVETAAPWRTPAAPSGGEDQWLAKALAPALRAHMATLQVRPCRLLSSAWGIRTSIQVPTTGHQSAAPEFMSLCCVHTNQVVPRLAAVRGPFGHATTDGQGHRQVPAGIKKAN